jgi:hypothetical protein
MTVNVMVPSPVPLALEVIVSHESVLVADHAHDPSGEIRICPLPPSAPMFCVEGESVTGQGAAP